MGVRTYLRFVDEQNLMLYLRCLHQSLKVVTKFQQPILESFSNRLCWQNLKEKRILVEFETKVEVMTKHEWVLKVFWNQPIF